MRVEHGSTLSQRAVHAHVAAQPPAVDGHTGLGESQLPGQARSINRGHQGSVQIENKRVHRGQL